MKLTIKITQSQQREVREHRAALKTALDDFIGHGLKLDKTEKRREAVVSQLEKLEGSTEPDDRAGIQRIAELRVERDLLLKKVENLTPDGSPKSEALHALLKQSGQLISTVCAGSLEAFRLSIAKEIRRFYCDDAWALGVARETPAAAAANHVVHMCYGQGFALRVGEAERVLEVLDQLLAGELECPFDPKL